MHNTKNTYTVHVCFMICILYHIFPVSIRSTEGQTAENEPSSYVAPEILNDKPYEEKT